jgi:hypothetical protein
MPRCVILFELVIGSGNACNGLAFEMPRWGWFSGGRPELAGVISAFVQLKG